MFRSISRFNTRRYLRYLAACRLLLRRKKFLKYRKLLLIDYLRRKKIESFRESIIAGWRLQRTRNIILKYNFLKKKLEKIRKEGGCFVSQPSNADARVEEEPKLFRRVRRNVIPFVFLRLKSTSVFQGKRRRFKKKKIISHDRLLFRFFKFVRRSRASKVFFFKRTFK